MKQGLWQQEPVAWGALPRTARALQGSPSFTILGGLASRNCRKALSCAERVCWVSWSKEPCTWLFFPVWVLKMPASSPVTPVQGPSTTPLEPRSTSAEPRGPHALCPSCLPAAGAADGVA